MFRTMVGKLNIQCLFFSTAFVQSFPDFNFGNPLVKNYFYKYLNFK